jgi:hypothetical protein
MRIYSLRRSAWVRISDATEREESVSERERESERESPRKKVVLDLRINPDTLANSALLPPSSIPTTIDATCSDGRACKI